MLAWASKHIFALDVLLDGVVIETRGTGGRGGAMDTAPCNVHISVHPFVYLSINPLTPNDHYSGRTAPLTSKGCILYIYSTNTGTEYFKRGIYSPFFSLQNAVCFIILTYLVPVLFTFYIQSVLKIKKKIIPAPKG